MPNIHCPNISALILTGLSAGLQYPAITLETSKQERMRIYLGSKGLIYIKINGEYIGKILNNSDHRLVIYQPESHWIELITHIESNPSENIGIHGKRTGTCCFCARQLENAGSLHYGYGPTCAEKFALPWHYEKSPQSEITEIF